VPLTSARATRTQPVDTKCTTNATPTVSAG
jgi:hypothetical protein